MRGPITWKKVLVVGVVGAIAAAVLIVVLDLDEIGPDADQQETAATRCLRRAGFTVKVEIPPVSRIGPRSPEYELEVREQGEVVAYIYLFDFPEDADAFVDDAKLDAETEGETPKIKQRGPAAVDVDSADRAASKIYACVDKAAKPPPDKG